VLIVREAGGFATDPDGREAQATEITLDVVSGNAHLHAPLREMVVAGLGG
jgi:myo-inositol-1(or 4)-monophosphatase